MNGIVSVIVVISVIFLIYALLMRSSRGTHSEALEEAGSQRLEDENQPLADGPPLPATDRDSRLTQQRKPAPRPEEHVTPSLTNAAGPGHCPACGALITAEDERCPSCEICFVADGSQKWTLGPLGPADGIYRSSTEVSE
jgi:hypothetical protein